MSAYLTISFHALTATASAPISKACKNESVLGAAVSHCIACHTAAAVTSYNSTNFKQEQSIAVLLIGLDTPQLDL